jgi:hypothetical protein
MSVFNIIKKKLIIGKVASVNKGMSFPIIGCYAKYATICGKWLLKSGESHVIGLLRKAKESNYNEQPKQPNKSSFICGKANIASLSSLSVC